MLPLKKGYKFLYFWPEGRWSAPHGHLDQLTNSNGDKSGVFFRDGFSQMSKLDSLCYNSGTRAKAGERTGMRGCG